VWGVGAGVQHLHVADFNGVGPHVFGLSARDLGFGVWGWGLWLGFGVWGLGFGFGICL